MIDLYVRSWGEGDQLAVLLHGMTTDSGSWSRLGPALAQLGYRVLAPDLPGHGQSPHLEYSLDAMAAAVVAVLPVQPTLMLGHSLGGLVLAALVGEVQPARAVFEDPPWGEPPGPEAIKFITAQQGWDVERLRMFHPRWHEDAVGEKHRALGLWDSATTAMVREYPGRRPSPPAVPSLVLRGDVGPMITSELTAELIDEGYEVRTVAGAGHNIHNDDFDRFWDSLDGWT